MPLPSAIIAKGSTVTINGDDFTVSGEVTRVNKSRNLISKSTFSGDYVFNFPAKKSATFSASGFATTDKAEALDEAYETGIVTCEVQMGISGGATDGGEHSGEYVISALNWEAAGEGLWQWNIEASNAAEVSYEPGQPASA